MTGDGLPRVFRGGLLRRLHTNDLAAFQAYRSIPELGRYQGWSPMSDAQALAFLDEMATAALFTPGEWAQVGIAGPDGERLVGDIGIFLAADAVDAEVGFTLEPSAQGHGIATAAVQATAALLFEATAVRQVRGITDARNAASIRLLQRAGFRLENSRSVLFRDEPCVEEVYVLARAEA